MSFSFFINVACRLATVILVGGLSCPRAGATVLGQIAGDFEPIAGYVVMVRNDGVVLDLDAADGVQVGDLFHVLSGGEDLVHPVTGEILGQLATFKGTLRVGRLQQGFSHARILESSALISPGDAVRRYERLPAVFWDYSGGGKPLFLMLRDALNHMDWMPYGAAQEMKPETPAPLPAVADAVVFVCQDDRLIVKGADFQTIREYDAAVPGSRPWEDAAAFAPAPAAARAETEARAPAVFVAKKKGLLPTKHLSPVFQSAHLLAKLPGGAVKMSAFHPQENGLLMATTDGSDIFIHQISDAVRLLAQQASPFLDPVIFLSWWRPDTTMPPMLVVVNFTDRSPVTTLYAWTGETLRKVRGPIPRFVAGFDADGDRQRELLLAQRFAPEEFFSRHIETIELPDGDLRYAAPGISFPARFTLSGSLLADLTGDGTPETVFIRNNILYIFSGEKLLHKSPKVMGGGLLGLTYDVNPGAQNLMTRTVTVEIPPVAADLDGDGAEELLAVASEQSFLSRASGLSSDIQHTWLAVLKYQEGVFQSGTLGEKINTPVQGMAVHDGKVLLVLTETGSLFENGGQSKLVAIPLAF